MVKHKSKEQKRQNRWVVFSGIMAVVTVLALCVYGYLREYYHSEVSVGDFAGSEVELIVINDGIMVDGSGNDKALIFYPGGKVEYTAYLPLMVGLAKQGIDCFLIKMPANLAVLDMHAARRVMDKYDYREWYIGGHSLGGAMAASYIASHKTELRGLIMLGAYTASDLREDVRVLSVYGDKDTVINMGAYELFRENLSGCGCRFHEVVVEGGNHVQFGEYGEQAGDGVAVISADEQRWQTIEAITDFIYQ